MWTRYVTGIGALCLYGRTLEDPKGSFILFHDASDWLTSHVLSGDGVVIRMVRNIFNDILIDQFEGFLLGIAVATWFSALAWPLRACYRFAGRTVRRAPAPGGN